MEDGSIEITRLLASGEGVESLLPYVYEELRRIAGQRMGAEKAQHTLQATALVNEAYLRLLGTTEMSWRDREHFYAAAAEAMRRVLVDHARRVQTQKRGGAHHQISLGAPDIDQGMELEPERFLALDEALTQLEREDQRASKITRLRFFGGLEMGQIAATLGVSERTVHREWTFARTRLFELLGAS